MSVTVHPVSLALGAEIRGVDLRGELDEPTFEVIDRAWRDYKLLLFRDQVLTPQEQVRFTTHFGPVFRMGSKAYVSSGDDVRYISNVVEGAGAPNKPMLFHSDCTAFEQIVKAVALYAVEVPTHGGDTVFANAQKAYEILPDSLKRRIANLSARHVHDYSIAIYDRRLSVDEMGPGAASAVHRVVWPHPEDGKPVLFVNDLMTQQILDLEPDDGDALLRELLSYISDPRVTYTHKWRVNDLCIWDNRALQHGRTDFDPSEKRTLRRVPIAEPVAP